jgi:glycosyltransferase involved in cell wall biosynthesis
VEEDADNKRNGFKLLNDRLLSMVGFGYTLLEAMACDLCILGYAVGGTLGMMTDGVNGATTRAGDSGTLADAVPWCY